MPDVGIPVPGGMLDYRHAPSTAETSIISPEPFRTCTVLGKTVQNSVQLPGAFIGETIWFIQFQTLHRF
jgi:hypothetical protein